MSGRSRASAQAVRYPAASLASLRRHLEALAADYDYARHLQRDPLRFVLAHDTVADMEVAGMVAACLAYGRVDRVLVAAGDVLGRMGRRPADFVRGFDATGRAERKIFRGFVHRMTGEDEMRALCAALGGVLREHGRLEPLFAEAMTPGAVTIRPGLEHLVAHLRQRATVAHGSGGEATRRLRFMLPSPAEGSACKRLNMWLRWMVRRQTGLDPGPWTSATADQLVIPLDVHVVRFSHFFGLTNRRTPDWKMAEQVTALLRRLDPHDPVKYDFALSHIGMSGNLLPAV